MPRSRRTVRCACPRLLNPPTDDEPFTSTYPVYMGYFDWGTKRISRGQKVELTDDPKADMARIQALYEEMHLVGKHPEKYVTH